jgi:hypothetical protein
MRRRALLGVMLISMIGGTWTANAKQDSAQHRAVPLPGWAIVGTWSVQVALANCDTGQESGPTFPALNTFLAEGSMLSDPAASPGRLRTGHGVWAHAGGRQFTNTVVLFQFNVDGSYAGTQTVRREIAVSRDADAFTAHDTVTIADPGGTVLDTRCGIGRGRRLHP